MTRIFWILFPFHPCPSAPSVVNHCFPLFIAHATGLLASPKQASAMPARPTPNFFNAARRVTDWAIPLVSSSNWLFIIPAFVHWLLFVIFVWFA